MGAENRPAKDGLRDPRRSGGETLRFSDLIPFLNQPKVGKPGFYYRLLAHPAGEPGAGCGVFIRRSICPAAVRTLGIVFLRRHSIFSRASFQIQKPVRVQAFCLETAVETIPARWSTRGRCRRPASASLTIPSAMAKRLSAAASACSTAPPGTNSAAVCSYPLVQTPVVQFDTLSTFTSAQGFISPPSVIAWQQDMKAPEVMNVSLTIQRNIGFGTVVDVSYSGSLARRLSWQENLEPVPLGAQFNPANANPASPGTPLPNAFLVPLQGYSAIAYNADDGTSSTYLHK
jgi:hypothetical protein